MLAVRPVVVSFFRGGWCPYCSLELRRLQKELVAIESLATLIAISPQISSRSVETRTAHELSFPILSDVDGLMAKAYGLSFELPLAVRPVYANLGVDLKKINGNDLHQLPIPATFAIGEDRSIIKAFADEDYTRRPEPSEILAAFQTGSRK